MQDKKRHLRTIIKYCQDISDIQNTNGIDYETYIEDKTYQYSISFCVEQIGETAKKLRDLGIMNQYPSVPWDQIAGIRNRIAHGYEAIDLEMVFDISVEDIPKLLTECKRILDIENRLEEIYKEPKEINAADIDIEEEPKIE